MNGLHGKIYMRTDLGTMVRPTFFAVTNAPKTGIYTNIGNLQVKDFKKFKSLNEAVSFLRSAEVSEDIVQQSLDRLQTQLLSSKRLHEITSDTNACDTQTVLSRKSLIHLRKPNSTNSHSQVVEPRKPVSVERRPQSSQIELSSTEPNSSNTSSIPMFDHLITKCTSLADQKIDFCTLSSLIRSTEVDWKPMIIKLKKTMLLNGKLVKRTRWSNSSQLGQGSLQNSDNLKQPKLNDNLGNTPQSSGNETNAITTSIISSLSQNNSPEYLGFKQTISREEQLSASSNLNLSQALNAPLPRFNSCRGKFKRLKKINPADRYEYESDDSVVAYICPNRNRGASIFWSKGHPDNKTVALQANCSNQSEIQAATEAIHQAANQGKRKITIRTCNPFLVKAALDWLPDWIQNDWKQPKTNVDVKNKSHFKRLIFAMGRMEKVTWQQVHPNLVISLLPRTNNDPDI